MSALNGLHDGAELSPLRRFGFNIMAAFRLLLRPARGGTMWPRDGRRAALLAGAALAAFFLCMVLLDAASIRAVGRLPPSVPWLFDQITDYGKSGWFLWPLGVLLVILAVLPRSRLTNIAQRVLAAVTVRVGFLFLAIGVPGLFINIVKKICGRARPLVPGNIDPFAFDPFNWSAAYASLPSGHATTVFSVLVAFGSLWPRARGAIWIYALVIIASRIAVTAHFPSDVLAGAVIGSVGALIVRRYFALRRLAFTIGPDGAVKPLAGPSPRRLKAVARGLFAP